MATPATPTECRVDAPGEVAALLRVLLTQQTRVTLSNAAGLSVNSSICALDAAHAAMNFDMRRGDPALQALLASSELSAVAYLDDIRVQFELDEPMLVNNGAGVVLRARLPGSLYRFQRRQAFRVRLSSDTPQVRLAHPQQQTELRARILDLSVSGLALLLPPALTAWPTGTVVTAASVELDRDTRFSASLRSHHVHPFNAAGTLVGMAFAQIDHAATCELHRYIDQTQKRSRLLRLD